MGWTAPRTYTVGEIITKAIMDAHVRDNLRYLKGLDGVPTIESGLTIDNTDGDERLLLPLLSTAECATVLNAEGEVAFDETTHQVKIHNGTAVKAVISEADVDDTPVNGADTVPVSSNWAYDFINTLSAEADIPYATAAGVWARLPHGTAQQYLRVNAGLTAPEWATPPYGVKVKAETRDVTAASGDVAYTGYGFTPTGLAIMGYLTDTNGCMGTSDSAKGMIDHELNSGSPVIAHTRLIMLYEAADKYQEAVIKTYDADGFTLTWTKVGVTAARTGYLTVIAFAN